MADRKGNPRLPGIARERRLSAEGLQRLERQLEGGSQISDAVLAQWIRRYGEAARAIIRRHGRYRADLETQTDRTGTGDTRKPARRDPPR